MIMNTLLMAFEVHFSLKRLITLSTCKWLEARKMFSLMCNPVFIFNLKRRENLWIYYDASGEWGNNIWASIYLQVWTLGEAFRTDGAFIRLFTCEARKINIERWERIKKCQRMEISCSFTLKNFWGAVRKSCHTLLFFG